MSSALLLQPVIASLASIVMTASREESKYQPRSVLSQAELFLCPFACCDVRRDVVLNCAPGWPSICCSKPLECYHLARSGQLPKIVRPKCARFAQFK